MTTTVDDALPGDTQLDDPPLGDGGYHDLKALDLIRRGLRASPELLDGLKMTVAMGFAVAMGRLAIPILVERAIDNGVVDGADGGTTVEFDYIGRVGAAAAAVILIGAAISFAAQRRLVRQAEAAIANLRIKTFDRIHHFSMADHSETRKGVLVSRVTSDAETLARFAQWGLYIWSIQPIVALGIVLVLAYYSWQLALVVVVVHLPVIPILRWLQRRQIEVYDDYRDRVSEMLAAFSETVSGSAVVRAYGAENRFRADLVTAIDRRYRTKMRANRYMAGLFVVGDLFGAVAFVAILVLGLWQRQAWGLDAGDLVAVLFLTSLLREPIAELAEVLDQTQVAAASWRKILDVLDHPVDIQEPVNGRNLEPGPIDVDVEHLSFAYRHGEPVLRDVSVHIPSGTNVAVVGETGSGKTTFVKLLCRLADPTSGSIRLNGVVLADIAPESRVASVRMVPQDGFLFNTTVAENVRFGAEHCTDRQLHDAFATLGLDWWLEKQGLDTEVGERGENLSVGERQLVALARAQLADPGLLILDEATSAVDPETDQALTQALKRLAEGRTMISVAHRLSTAEAADLVLVFDRGGLVEVGSHAELVQAGGIYAGLYRAWVGNTGSPTPEVEPPGPGA